MKMIKAIKLAAGNASMTDGLRAIKRFEKVNGLKFSPENARHRLAVESCGEDERFFRRYIKALNRNSTKDQSGQ